MSAPAEDEPQMPFAFEDMDEKAESESERADVIPDVDRVRKGGFFRRLSAFSVDVLLQCVILYFFLLAGVYALKKGASLTGSDISIELVMSLVMPIFLITFIVSAGYFTFFHWAAGQTPGKMLFRLKVVRVDGGPLTIGSALLRWFCYIISAMPLMSGYIMILIDRQKQALHDKIAGTYVVDARTLSAVEAEEGFSGEMEGDLAGGLR